MSGTDGSGVVLIGLDDTDHVDHACTTEHFQRLLSRLERDIDGFFVVERRLVRLWPFAPTRTRGNAALSAVCELGPGGEAALVEVNRICEEFIHSLSEEIDTHYPREGGQPDPCLVVSTVDLPEDWYWQAVRREVSRKNRVSNLPDSVTIHSINSQPKGLIGATSAIAWKPNENATWELIAWRQPARIRTPRDILDSSISEMSERFTGTFANRDPTTGRGMIMPRTNCPVLYGVRGDSPEELRAAHRFLQEREDVEECSSWAIHRTNQVSDDHLQGYRSGVIVSSPKEVQGGHSSVRIWDGESTQTLVAFAESGPVNSTLRGAQAGDLVDWLGLRSPNGEVHLERFRLTQTAPRISTRPFCCAKAMRSAGKGQGLRCTICGEKATKAWLARKVNPTREFQGWVEPSVANRRHLARPLARGLPKAAKPQV